MPKFQVNPGRMDTMKVAIDLLGLDSIVDAGAWRTPFYVECSGADAQALEDLLRSAMVNAKDPEIKYLSVKEVP